MYTIILKFNTKSSPISIVNLKQKTDSKLEVIIKAIKRNAGDHHQKQLLLMVVGGGGGGGGGGRAKYFVCARTRSPGSGPALSCYLSLIFKHSDTTWDLKNI